MLKIIAKTRKTVTLWPLENIIAARIIKFWAARTHE